MFLAGWKSIPLSSHAPASRAKQRRGVFIMLNEIRSDVASEVGQTMAEYAVVLGVITIAVVVTLGLLSAAIKNLLSNVISAL
jgi:Flp pilus assembly pilin Flp